MRVRAVPSCRRPVFRRLIASAGPGGSSENLSTEAGDKILVWVGLANWAVPKSKNSLRSLRLPRPCSNSATQRSTLGEARKRFARAPT